MTIALADERRADQGDGTRDHGAMMQSLREVGAGSQGMAVLDETLMVAFDASAKAQDVYYEFVLNTTIAGLRMSAQ